MTPESYTALAILILTYVGVAIGRVPGLRLDRAGIAFLGGAAMIALGPLSLEEAFRAIDFDTIALLLGMMIVVAHLKVSGAFRALGALAIEYAHAPFLLLVIVTVLAGVLSAFLVNDAICLVMAPIVLQVVRSLGRNPLPYLVAVATASNCGSVATITGNPQNMVIGTLSRIPYPAFAAALAPVAAFSLVAVILMVRLVYAKEFAFKGALEPHLFRGHMHGGQVLKATVTCVALALAFFAGVAPAKAAIIAGAFLLLTRQIKPHRIYRELDGPLLILFAGMFVVVAGAEKALLTPERIEMAKTLGLDMVWRLSLFTAVLSNIVSNVPAVLALQAVHSDFPRSRARLARGRDEFDAGRQLHPAWISRQPHRCRTRPRGGHADQLLGLFQGRRAADDHHARGRDLVAHVAVVRPHPIGFADHLLPEGEGCASHDRSPCHAVAGATSAAIRWPNSASATSSSYVVCKLSQKRGLAPK